MIIITGFGSIGSVVDAMKKGAYDYVTKPFNLDELLLKVRKIRDQKIAEEGEHRAQGLREPGPEGLDHRQERADEQHPVRDRRNEGRGLQRAS